MSPPSPGPSSKLVATCFHIGLKSRELPIDGLLFRGSKGRRCFFGSPRTILEPTVRTQQVLCVPCWPREKRKLSSQLSGWKDSMHVQLEVCSSAVISRWDAGLQAGGFGQKQRLARLGSSSCLTLVPSPVPCAGSLVRLHSPKLLSDLMGTVDSAAAHTEASLQRSPGKM